jgi:GT2 family glycosyltransferase
VLGQSDADLSVLIVDNGSTDDSLKRFEELSGPSCRLSALESNRGFAEGMNTGLREAVTGDFEYVWLLNNDAFPRQDCLQRLVERMRRDPQLAMVTPRLVLPDGTEQHAGGTVNWSTGELHQLPPDRFTEPCGDGYWLTGTAPLIRTAAVLKSGFFEPAFFAYCEDADLSVRLTRAGGCLAAVPEAVATHVEGGSSGAHSPVAHFLGTRNTWLFLKRNAPTGSHRARWLRFVATMTRRAALWDMEGRPALAGATLAGISAARQERFGPPDSPIEPANLERWTFHAPWRWCHLLNKAADWLEPPDGVASAAEVDV